ncbi:MAG TPA: endonuclease/exonuclease/phosphatase family protein [Gaiellaceae bacterium]|nr:endonuclease/exonuclease/phosphatase family protein [Gaiellaceae bacterium]
MLVRSWNLFHGNTVPPQRRAFLDDMIRRTAVDEPNVLCVQEVPAWALGRFTVGDVAARPRLGPLPIPAELGRALTAPNHGLLRSAFSGQGNAMQLSPRLTVLQHDVLTLNARAFRARQARALGLDLLDRLAWAKERRIVQVVRLGGDGRTVVVANTHCSGAPLDERVTESELIRAAWFATSLARPDEAVVLAGDFNLRSSSGALQALASSDWGFSAPGPGIDHILVRGARVSELRVWSDEERAHGLALLSDHAPVELELELA